MLINRFLLLLLFAPLIVVAVVSEPAAGELVASYHACPACNKVYRWKRNLRRHVLLECGDKTPRHPCPCCPYQSKHKADLQRHCKRLHAGLEIEQRPRQPVRVTFKRGGRGPDENPLADTAGDPLFVTEDPLRLDYSRPPQPVGWAARRAAADAASAALLRTPTSRHLFLAAFGSTSH